MSLVVVGDRAPLVAVGLATEMSVLMLVAATTSKQASKHTSRVIIIPLCFQPAQHCLALDDLELHALNLVMEEAIERHFGDRAV